MIQWEDNPEYTKGFNWSKRPILAIDIQEAINKTDINNATEAANYMNINYLTYKKWALRYSLFYTKTGPKAKTRITSGRSYSLQLILEGKYPGYSIKKLAKRIIASGLVTPKCGLCGYSKARELDGKYPLQLYTVDGNTRDLRKENLQFRCFNCIFHINQNISTYRDAIKGKADPTYSNVMIQDEKELDQVDPGMSIEEIRAIQEQVAQEISKEYIDKRGGDDPEWDRYALDPE